MFIPVSYYYGLYAIDCVASLTGKLRAGCEVIHNSVTYPAGTDVNVVRGDTVRLRTTITARADITVTLAGQSFNWAVDLPKNIRYVQDLAFKRITGSAYGKLYKFPEIPNGTAYTVTGTVANTEELTVSYDYVKKEIWFFGPNGVKKISTPDTPVAVVHTPRWSLNRNVATTYYVITEKFLYPVSKSMDLVTASAVAVDGQGTVRAASGDNFSGVTFISDTKLQRWTAVTGVTTLADVGGYDVQIAFDSTIVVAKADNTVYAAPFANPANGSVIYDAGRAATFVLDTSHKTRLFIADMQNRMIVAVDYSNGTLYKRYLDYVPSGIQYDFGSDSVYVGLLTEAKTLKLSTDLDEVLEEKATVKAAQFAAHKSLFVTDLYTNAANVTSSEAYETVVASLLDVQVNTVATIDVPILWSRPQYVEAEAGATVTRNGQPFTSGYVCSPDVLTVTMPAEAAYWKSYQVDFMGAHPISVYFRTEPKLFPDKVVLPAVLEAFPRRPYTAEFDITGITDSFSADLVAESEYLTFSINGGAFGTEGTVKNGDRVVAQVLFKNMLAVRDNHNIITLDDHIASEWQVLPVQLNGAQVVHDKSLEKSNAPDVFEADSTAPYQVEARTSVVAQTLLTSAECEVEVDGYYSDPNMLIDYGAPLVVRDTLVERSLIAALYTPTAQWKNVAPLRFNGSVQPEGSLTFDPVPLQQTTIVLLPVEPERIAQTTNEYATAPERIAQTTNEYATAPERIAQTTNEYATAPERIAQTTNEYATAPVLLQDATVDITTSIEVLPAKTTEWSFDWVRSSHDTAYEWFIDAVQLEQSNGVEASTGIMMLQDATVDIATLPMFLPNATFAITMPFVLEHRLFQFIDQLFDVRTRTYRAPIAMAYDIGRAAKRFDTAMLHSMGVHRHGEDSAVQSPERRTRTTVDVNTDGDIRHGAVWSSMDVEHGVARSAKRVDLGTIEAYRLTNTRVERTVTVERGASRHGVELAMPAAQWSTSHADSTSTADTGFFATRGEAEDYADSLNLEASTPPVFFQIEGKWLLYSTPVADSAVCLVTQLPPGAQHRFGYIGGG